MRYSETIQGQFCQYINLKKQTCKLYKSKSCNENCLYCKLYESKILDHSNDIFERNIK